MQRLLTLVAMLILLTPAQAEKWRSEQYRCELTLPEGEAWVRGTPLRLPAGEMLFIASHAPSKQTVAVIAIPGIPSNDMENPAVVSRIIEAVMALGFSINSHAPVKVNEESFLQLYGRRTESAAVNLVCVARAAMRDKTIHLALTFGQGDEERTTDKHFLRVLDTFTLLDSAPTLRAPVNAELAPYYHLAYQTCWIAVGVLTVAAGFVFFFSRHHPHHHA